MTKKQAALRIMQHNLTDSYDWIVLNQTMETLGKWAKKDTDLKGWIIPYLERLKTDARKSVAEKANKTLTMLLS
ncbi:hypothetical protein L0P88_01625 [Muricauda sp. SCSIO 64092]|uniref:hypothetical protein n=1 Tax=Allomuricauda sp. SCSIO 64092 TaxID=2908842 RepID=UPI001FF15EE9|nr:hypothetical protein [Muricauda sp. SCSIO 64092]UOY07264.1 hypothetical protein L0P88_01625 [Muricauda sp. SCSIO 64092]